MSTSMPMPDNPDAIRAATLQGQIIIGALVAGLLTFLVIVTVLDTEPKAGGGAGGQGAVAADASLPIITYVAVAFAAATLPMSFVIPLLVAKQQRQAIASGKLTARSPVGATPGKGTNGAASSLGGLPVAFLTQLIVGAAMNEGAAFFALVAYLIEKNPIALAVAIVLIAGVIARFPTAGRVERWLEQQREKLREDQLDALSSH